MTNTPNTPPAPPVASTPTPAAHSVQPIYMHHPPHKPSFLMRMIRNAGWVLFGISVLIIFYLALFITATTGAPFGEEVIREGDEKQQVVIFSVRGVINAKTSGEFRTFYQSIKDNDDIKAVVLRVDSPGGTVTASEQIHHMITQLKDGGKKVVVSMGGLAASGGYMISCPADHIVAEPSTITGSIGVIAQVPNFAGTLDKIGMKMRVYKSSNAKHWKDALSTFRDPKDYETKRLLEILDTMQTQFETAVTTGRGNRLKPITEKVGDTEDSTKAPFNGKIYLADEALKLGLVDSVGFIEVAIDKAIELAGTDKDKTKVVWFTKRRGLVDQLLNAEASIPAVSTEMLDKIQTPRVLMLWQMES